MPNNCDKDTNITNSHTDASTIIRIVEKKIADAVQRINDLQNAESERINQIFTNNKEIFYNKLQAQKELNDTILKERDEKLVQKFESLATAIDKAETATDERFHTVNEFRNTMSDQQKTFMTSNEYKTAHQTLTDLIWAQKERIDKIEAIKQGGYSMWVIIVGVIGFLTGLISFIMNMLGK